MIKMDEDNNKFPEDSSEFNISLDTLKEIRNLLNAANEHSYKKELNKWKDVLFVICKEVDYMELEEDEEKRLKELKSKLNKHAKQYCYYVDRKLLHQFQEYGLYFEALTDFEKLLRGIMYRKGMLLKKKDWELQGL